MTLNWTAASPTTGITGYAILVSTDGGTSYAPLGSVALGTNTFNATGLTPNTVYTFAIHSYGGESTLSTNPTTYNHTGNQCLFNFRRKNSRPWWRLYQSWPGRFCPGGQWT